MLRKYTLDILYWLIIGLLSFLILFILVKLFPFYRNFLRFSLKIFLPFIISCVIAYLLYPIVKKIESYRVQTSLAILIIYLFFFGGSGLLIYHSLPAMMNQLQELSEQLPDLIKMYEQFIMSFYESTSFLPETIQEYIDHLFQTIEKRLEQVLKRTTNQVIHFFDVIVIVTVIPVLVFYLLKDYAMIKDYFKKISPKKYHRSLGGVIKAIDYSLGNYIRGQLIVCLFVGIASWIALEIIGIKYAVLLGFIMGLTNIIPYFGPLIGVTPALLIAATQSSKYIFLVIVAAFIVQMIENNLLSPFIVGKSVNIHPIVIIFVLLLGGQLGGILGMIVAVPLFTMIRETLRTILRLRDNQLTYR